MRWQWPWTKPTPADGEADQALAQSVRRLHDARRQAGLVDRLVASLDREGQVNNFQARIAAAFREHR